METLFVIMATAGVLWFVFRKDIRKFMKGTHAFQKFPTAVAFFKAWRAAQDKYCTQYGEEQNADAQCRSAAERGDADAQWRLGNAYLCGKGVPQDGAEAMMWYRRAAEQGHAGAHCQLGYLYSSGSGVDSEQKGMRGFKARMSTSGLAVDQDENKALEHLRRAAEQGHGLAQVLLAMVYGGGTESHHDEYDFLERQGQRMDRAIGSFSFGIKVEIDEDEAHKWWRRAADSGPAEMQYALGLLYSAGLHGVPHDAGEAEWWYRRAAEQGSDDAKKALRKLGRDIPDSRIAEDKQLTGDGKATVAVADERDARGDYAQLLSAAEQGDAKAQSNLGDMYREGEGVEKDYVEAEKWYRLAAEQGDDDAKEALRILGRELPDNRIAESKRLTDDSHGGRAQ